MRGHLRTGPRCLEIRNSSLMLPRCDRYRRAARTPLMDRAAQRTRDASQWGFLNLPFQVTLALMRPTCELFSICFSFKWRASASLSVAQARPLYFQACTSLCAGLCYRTIIGTSCSVSPFGCSSIPDGVDPRLIKTCCVSTRAAGISMSD